MTTTVNQAVALQQKALLGFSTKSKLIISEQSALLMQYGINPDVFGSALHNAIISNPMIAECTEVSVFKAVRDSISQGICPDGREAAMVPFNAKIQVDGKDVWVKECKFLPMKEGLARVFTQAVKGRLQSGRIYEGDEILELDLGMNPKISIRPDLFGERGNLIGTWSSLKLPDGQIFLKVFTRVEIEAARNASRAKNGPWNNYYGAMAEKSVVKSLLNSLRHLIPKDSAHAARMDAMLDKDPEHETAGVDIEDADFETVTEKQRIADRSNAPAGASGSAQGAGTGNADATPAQKQSAKPAQGAGNKKATSRSTRRTASKPAPTPAPAALDLGHDQMADQMTGNQQQQEQSAGPAGELNFQLPSLDANDGEV